MAIKTLAYLRSRVRKAADMVNSKFVSDAEINEYINESAAELYDLLVAANVDYYNTTLAFSISSGSTYALPVDFYKLRGLDINSSGEYIPVYNYNYLERNLLQNITIGTYYSNVQYAIVGNNIEFLPAANAIGSYRLRYVPYFVEMDDDADTFDGKNGFEKYIIVDAAIECKDKEESDTSRLQSAKNALLQRIQAMALNRDYGAADKVVDARSSQAWSRNGFRL